jgi:Tfp pilus assembly protein PilF
LTNVEVTARCLRRAGAPGTVRVEVITVIARGSPATRRVILVAVVLAAAAVAMFGARWLHASGERDEALRLAQAGRFADAEPLLQKALARDRDDVAVISALAQVKLGSPDPATAEEYLTRWCELRPHEAEPFRLRMDLRHRVARGKWSTADRMQILEQAIADGHRALELAPDNDLARREVGSMLLQVGRFAEAEQHIRGCLTRAPADPTLRYQLAKACHAQGQRAEAEAALDPVIGDRSASAEALLLRAILYREADQPDRAIPLLRQALNQEKCPRKDCLYHLGLALGATGQKEEARRVLAELDLLNLQDAIANNQFPDNAAMRVQVAEAMLGAGKAEEARAKLEAVLAEAPDFKPAHRVLALYYEQKGQPERAAEHRRLADR